MPEPPGPPGLNTSEPSRWSSSAVAIRATAMSIVSPSATAWSSGTTSVAHSSWTSSGTAPLHADQSNVPVSGFGATEPVSGVVTSGVPSDGSAPTVTTSGDAEHAEPAASAIRARTRRTIRRYR